jgi:3-oxoacyl-[acyl-carrier protein] reductase
VSGITGLPRQVNYSASKGAMNAFTKALAKEVSPYGVRVNAVAPGLIKTDITDNMNEKHRDEILKTIPLGRMGTPEDVANCVKFLLSPSAAYITGQILTVDGGLTMR